MGIRIVKNTATRPLLGMAHRARHQRPMLKKVGHFVAEISRGAFRKGANPETGARWQPLAESTKRRRRGTSYQILVDRGRLRKSIRHLITGQKSVAIGSNLVYAPTHQLGRTAFARTSWRSGGGSSYRIPARPYLGLGERDAKAIQLIVKRWIATGAK